MEALMERLKREEAEADAAIAQIKGDQTPEPEVVSLQPETTPEPEPTPAPTQVTEPAATVPEPASPDVQPDGPPTLNAPDPQRASDIEYWRHRASTIDGMLRSAKEKHAAQTANLHERIANLEKITAQQTQMIDMLRENPTPAVPSETTATSAAPAPASAQSLTADAITVDQLHSLGYTEQQIEEYGLEWIQASALPHLREAEERRKIQEQMVAMQQERAADMLMAEVERLCPGAGRINASASSNGFAEFLNERVVGGRTHRELADAALKQGDPARLAEFFQTFLDRQHGGRAPEPAVVAPATPAVLPRTAVTSSVQTAQPGPRRFPAGRSLAAYDDFIQGRYKDPSKFRQIDSEIGEAARANNIDFGV